MREKLFDVNYLKHLCQKYGFVPSKKYGQNFLISPEPIEKMIEAAEISNEDVVVEVGPGFGALTFALAEKAKRVIAFEIEKKIKPYWDSLLSCHSERAIAGDEESLSQIERTEILRSAQDDKHKYKNDNIEIVWGNVLKSLRGEIPRFARDKLRNPLDRHAEFIPPEAGLAMTGNYKVVANLPYQITSEAIRKFLEAEQKPELMVFMVQKEVAERICAKPGDMSVLSVSVQYYADPEIAAYVSRSYFWPEPAVDSAVIKLSLRPRACRSVSSFVIPTTKEESLSGYSKRYGQRSLVVPTWSGLARDDSRCDDSDFFKIVKTGFANRRKFLIKNLQSIIGKQNREKLKRIFIEIGLDEKVRAQELSVEQWKELNKRLA